MTALVGTNVVLDVMLGRQPHLSDSVSGHLALIDCALLLGEDEDEALIRA